MDHLDLFLFGFPRIEYQGNHIEIERRKALALAAYLALSERPQSRDVLADLLWPDLDQKRARAALRSTLPALTLLSPQAWLRAAAASTALFFRPPAAATDELLLSCRSGRWPRRRSGWGAIFGIWTPWRRAS